MPHEVVTTPSTVTVLSANLPGLVCTSEIEREPIEAHAPPSADAAMIRPMTKFLVRPMASLSLYSPPPEGGGYNRRERIVKLRPKGGDASACLIVRPSVIRRGWPLLLQRTCQTTRAEEGAESLGF